MTATLLLQARTNSSRLPGKVLLPVAGIPLVILAALRAGNTGHRVVVVTSWEHTDDALCNILDQWEINYFRGELKNTLKRFVDALEGEDDDQLVIRLTGDNVFPDGPFIDELLKDFVQRSLDYLGCGGDTSGLPYGVSAEVTRVGHLREANKQATSVFDREHVTPKVIEKFGRTSFEKYRSLNMSQYRCTVDILDDYLRLSRLFNANEKPEKVLLTTLLDRLKRASPEVVSPVPASRFVLGTAQFGLTYGITNTRGKPLQKQVDSLVHTAIANGVQYLDTARAYGDSEEVLGKVLPRGRDSRATIITKLSPLDDCPVNASSHIVRAFVEQSLFQSCQALRRHRLDVVMLHRAEHLTAWHGSVWEKLTDLKHRRVIGRLGVSVQSPEEAMWALDFEAAEFIQLPFNILDYRWDAVIEKISLVRQRRRLVIHARSVLLQGLLTTTDASLWCKAKCMNYSELLAWLEEKANIFEMGVVPRLCIKFVLSQRWIDGIVIGVDTKRQLIDNLFSIGSSMYSKDELAEIVSNRPSFSEEILNPNMWDKNLR